MKAYHGLWVCAEGGVAKKHSACDKNRALVSMRTLGILLYIICDGVVDCCEPKQQCKGREAMKRHF
jgi:hypothetical protein